MEICQISHAIKRLLLNAFAGLSLSACGNTLDWKQEVPLQDGRVIVVDRESKQGPYDPFVAMRMETTQSLTFIHPDTREKIHWRIPDGLQPHMLDFDEGTPYLLLKAYTVSDYNKWGCPNPPYVLYRHDKGQWKQIPFEQLPPRFVLPNLISMAKSNEQFILNGYASVTNLRGYQKRVAKQFQSINREKGNPIAHGCFDDVLVKQGRQSEIDYRR